MAKYKLLVLALKIYIILIICFVVGVFFYIMVEGEYFPTYEDEIYLVTSTQQYFETNSTKATFTINESLSVIGEYNYYGPGYNIIYGVLAKIFGYNLLFFIVFHFISFLITIFLLWQLPFNKIKSLFLICIYISTYVAFTFIFTYYPETLNLLLSIILLMVFLKIKKNSNKNLVLFIILIFIFSLIRITHVFWIISILVFANNKNKKIWYFIICLGMFFLIILYMRLFTAPAWVDGLNYLYLENTSFLQLKHLIKRILIKGYLNTLNFYTKLGLSSVLILTFFAISIYDIMFNKKLTNWIKKKEYVLGLFMVMLTTIIAIFFFYTTNLFFLEKQIAFFIPVLIVIIIILKKNFKLLLFISFFVFLPCTIIKTINNVSSHKEYYKIVYKKKQYIDNLSDFKNFIKPLKNKKKISILWAYNEFDIPNNLTGLIMPLSINKTPILYTTNVCEIDAPDRIKFKTYNKIHIDYILSKDSVSISNIVLVSKKHNYYYLYKFI